jgi:type IV pilus assembly protein PilW
MEMKRKQKLLSLKWSNQGFTIVELVIALAVSLLALAAIYSTFLAQHRSYQVQSETADMQQNIRAAMYYMQREIRMAGSNPFATIPAFGITAAGASSITFTEDVRGAAAGVPPVPGPPDGDVGDPDENITYNLGDSDGDGVPDTLYRNGVPVAQNIDWLNFVYFDANGNQTATLADIRSVQITIVARTEHKLLYGSKNNKVYSNPQNTASWNAPGDNVSRRILTTTIKCRNLGI